MNKFKKYSIKSHTNLINNICSTKSNLAKFTGNLSWYQAMAAAKLHGKQVRIDVWIDV